MQAVAAEDTTTTEQASAVPHLRAITTPRTLSAKDVEDLRWYARQESRDAGYGSGSTPFSAMLERASLLSFGSRNCTRCGGTKDQPGRGFVPRLQRVTYTEQLRRYRLAEIKRTGMSAAANEKAAAALRLLGLEAYTWASITEFFPELPALLCRECPECRGRGLIERTSKARTTKAITARPNGGSRKGATGGGSGMNEADAHRRAKVDKRLAEVRHRQPGCAFVLDTWFGQSKGKESLVVLWSFTHQGRELLKQNRGQTAIAFFQARISAQAANPEPHRAWTHEQCDREARRLFGLACQTYNETA